MKQNNVFANLGSKALALAAVVTMSLAFTACSSDNNEEPEIKPNTVTIDGKKKTVYEAEYEDKTDGNYIITLYLSADQKERVTLCLNKDLHFDKEIDLTLLEEEHGEQYYWKITYNVDDDNQPIATYAQPEELYEADDVHYPVFNAGTLNITGKPEGDINIQLKNGQVIGFDFGLHTFTIHYKGKMKEVEI